MAERRDDDLLLVALIAALVRDDDDPMLGEFLYDTLQRQERFREEWGPELDRLLRRSLRYPRRSRRLEETRELVSVALDGFRKSLQEQVEGQARHLSALSSKIEHLADAQMDLSHALQAAAEGQRETRDMRMREIASAGLDGFRKSLQGHVDDQIGHLSTTLEELAGAQKKSSAAIEAGVTEQRETKDTIHSLLWLLESGADVRAASITRYVPVRIFLGNPVPDKEVCQELIARIEALFEPLDLERAYELPEESGSWWKRIVLRTKGFFTHEEVQKRLQKAERALEVKCLDKPQAEANHLQAQAAAGLIGSLASTPNACIQVGTLLLVKATDREGTSAIVARTLNEEELKMLEENQSVLKRPDSILEFLQSPRGRVTSR
jgi:hypothetical protein